MPQTINATITGYGWPDNDPPGAAIAFPGEALHDQAGGTGTYADPITFAGDPADTPVGSIIYVPSVQKYFVMEDTCASAMENSNDQVWVDLWVGGTAGDNAQSVLSVENALTDFDGTIILDPASNLPVSAGTLLANSGTVPTGSSSFAAAPADSGAIQGSAAADVLRGDSGVDIIRGAHGEDQLVAHEGADTLFGNQGADILFGNEGADILYGGKSGDVLYGGQGNDSLYGGMGDDLLVGGKGNDVLFGQDSADTFVFGAGQGSDRIADFSLAQGDTLDFGGQDYAEGTAADGSVSFSLDGGGTIVLTGISPDEFSGDHIA